MTDRPLYVSPEKLEQMEQELQYLKSGKRHEIADRIEKAKDLGDLSENADYHDAKEALEDNERRISQLADEIMRAIVITAKGGDKVTIGCTVRVKVNGKEKTLCVVGAKEANPLEGRISNESPIGLALLGKKAGATATVQAPAGPINYEIIAIE